MRKVLFSLIIVIARQLFFNRLSPLSSSRVRLQLQLRESIFPMSAFCICFCCTSHLWNVRLLWSCPLTWTKTTKNTGLSKGKTSLLLLWSLLCTCLCGENQCTILLKNCVTKLEMSWVTNLMNHQLLWQI